MIILVSKVKTRFKLSLPARATVFYTLTGALERGVGFIFTPIYTRILSPEEFGLYPLYVSWMGIATVIITLELTGNTVYRGMARTSVDDGEYISSTLGLLLTSGAVFGGLILIFRRQISSITSLNTTILAFLLLQTLLNGITGLYFASCRYKYRYKAPSLINLINAVVSPLLALYIIRLTSYKAEARIIAPLVVSIAVCIPILVGIFSRSRRFFSRAVWFEHLRTVIPLLPHFFAATVTVQSGKLAIARYFGEIALAKYSLAFSFGFIFTVITVGINSGLSPWINRKLASEHESEIGVLTEELFFIFAILSLMAIAFVPEGLSIMAPSEYLDALPAVYPLVISVIISFLTSILYSVAIYYDLGRLVTLGSILVAAVTVVLHILVTSKLGYVAAAVIACISGILNVLSYAVILGGVLKKRIFCFKKFIPPILFAVAFSLLMYLFRSSLLSRLALLLALLILLIPRGITCYRLIKEK